MNQYEIENFYMKEFQIWLTKIIEHREMGAANTGGLIMPEDIGGVTDENKKHVFCLLVFYNFLIHLFLYHHYGQNRYHTTFPGLVPYRNITNTFHGLDPFRYIYLPVENRLIKENVIRNICERVFTICVQRTISYFRTIDNFNVEIFFRDLLNEPEYRNGTPYIIITLSVVVEKLTNGGR